MFNPHETQMPGNLKIGDITSDGFPDILMTIKTGSSSSNMQTSVRILQNLPCTERYCSQLAVKKQRRFFTLKHIRDQSDDLIDAEDISGAQNAVIELERNAFNQIESITDDDDQHYVQDARGWFSSWFGSDQGDNQVERTGVFESIIR
jgi:hypothetical protein